MKKEFSTLLTVFFGILIGFSVMLVMENKKLCKRLEAQKQFYQDVIQDYSEIYEEQEGFLWLPDSIREKNNLKIDSLDYE